MSPLKRTERAKTKARARGGRHARPAEQSTADVPAELRPTDYGFPTVHLPEGHAHVTSAELIAALDDEPGEDETPTQTLPKVGKVVDETPKPVHMEGLEPAAAPSIPVPSTPFLNAGAPKPLESATPRPQVAAPLGVDQTEQLSGFELATLGRPVPASALPSVRPHTPKHAGLSREFDGEFWRQLLAGKRRVHTVADTLAANNDKDALSLDARLDRLEAWVRDASAQLDAAPLPRRVPGAAVAEIEASRGELVAR